MSHEYTRSDSQSSLPSGEAVAAVGGTTHSSSSLAFVAPPPLHPHAAEEDLSAVVIEPGSSEIPPELADSDPSVPAPPPEPQGIDAWVSYENTSDYRQHSSWALVRCGTWSARCKWFGYKILDGADYIGGALAGVLGITDSRYQYVIDAADRMAHERQQEAQSQDANEGQDATEGQDGVVEMSGAHVGAAQGAVDAYGVPLSISTSLDAPVAVAATTATGAGEEEEEEDEPNDLATGPAPLRAAPGPSVASRISADKTLMGTSPVSSAAPTASSSLAAPSKPASEAGLHKSRSVALV